MSTTTRRARISPWFFLLIAPVTWLVVGAGPQAALLAAVSTPSMPEASAVATVAFAGAAAALCTSWLSPRPRWAAGAGALGIVVVAGAIWLIGQAQHLDALLATTWRAGSAGTVVAQATFLVALAASLLGLLAGLFAVLGPVWLRGFWLAAPVFFAQDVLRLATSGLRTSGLSLGHTVTVLVFVLLGVVLGVSVTRSRWSWLSWVPALLVFWVAQSAAPALYTAASSVYPGATWLTANPDGPLMIAWDVFRAAFAEPGTHLIVLHWLALLWLVALAAGVAVGIARTRDRADGDDDGDGDGDQRTTAASADTSTSAPGTPSPRTNMPMTNGGTGSPASEADAAP